MKVERIVVGALETNCYVLFDEESREAVIVDPGSDGPKIQTFLTKTHLTAKYIIHTHGHYDHIGADGNFHIPVYIHNLDRDFLNNPHKNLSGVFGIFRKIHNIVHTVEDGDVLTFDKSALAVLHTPGHTPGGISLVADTFVLTGDTLFCGGVGRTDIPYASEKDLMDSIQKKLFLLDDRLIVYPGHGEKSTIGEEKCANPFFQSR